MDCKIPGEPRQSVWIPIDSDKQEIRLATILPSEDPAAEIEVQIMNVSLSSKPKYEALSYACGNLSVKQPIKLNSTVLGIGENLFTALQERRDPSYERILWIDALCIDQNNNTERSAQILLMHLIYTQAEQVVVWLGVADRHTAVALHVIREVANGVKIQDILYETHPISAEQLGAVATLLHRQWWTRTWVVQEAILAASAVFKCGNSEMPWSVLWRFDSHFAEQYAPFVSGAEPNERLAAKAIDDQRNETVVTLGMSKAAYDLFGKIESNVVTMITLMGTLIRYQVAVVYTEATLKIMLATNSTRPLTYAQRQSSSIQDLPSWMPDWSSYDKSLGHVSSRTERLPGRLFFDACRRHLSAGDSPGIVPGSTCLTLDGLPVDTVVEIREAYRPDVDLTNVYNDWTDTYCPKGSETSSYVSGGTVRDAFWKTLLSGAVKNGQSLRRVQPDDAEKFWDLWSSWLQRVPWSSFARFTGNSSELGPYGDAVATSADNRRMARTCKGYIGLIPITAAVGDQVFLLSGGREPYVLRASGRKTLQGKDAFLMVGDCYIHGIMDGEATYTDRGGNYAKSQDMNLDEHRRLDAELLERTFDSVCLI